MHSFIEIHNKTYAALPFILHSIGRTPRQSPILRPSGCMAHHLIWVTDGCGLFAFDGKEYRIGVGEGLFIRANVPHEYRAQDTAFSTAWVTFLMNDDFFSCLGFEDHFSFSVSPSFLSDYEQLHENVNSLTPLLRSAKGYALLTELLSSLLSERDSLSDRTCHLLESRYADSLSLDDVARALHMDKYALCRQFKKEKGRTVMEELHAIRIQKAKHLLRYSTEPIQVIGQQCGFESASYFVKRFRSLVGCTPTAYRSMKQ